MTVTPQTSAARLDVLVDGYVGDRVGSTATLVRDGDAVVVVDPGLVRSRDAILDPLRALGLAVEDVTDVVFSHHHLVGTPDGVVACTHLWWHADGPADDPYAPDPALLHKHRARVLDVAHRIVPGHGPSFTPGAETPR